MPGAARDASFATLKCRAIARGGVGDACPAGAAEASG